MRHGFNPVVVLVRKHGQPIGAVPAPCPEELRMHRCLLLRRAAHGPWRMTTWAALLENLHNRQSRRSGAENWAPCAVSIYTPPARGIFDLSNIA